MDSIEQKALELVNEVTDVGCYALCDAHPINLTEALCRAIEQHEAFRQEVSDAINDMVQRTGSNHGLYRFMLPPPDPLVEAMLRAWPQYADRMDACSNDAEALRAAIEKRGGRLVWNND